MAAGKVKLTTSPHVLIPNINSKMSTKTINILHLEDESMDAYLVRKVLDRAMLKFHITVVADKGAFMDAILMNSFDIILADHSMPQFTAMDALKILREKNIDIPLILVTGTVSEEYSVNAMKEGAWDYILKDRLQRLPSAVTSALERYQATVDRRQHMTDIIARESLMKEAERLASFGSWQTDLVNGISTWSDEKYRILGYTTGEVSPSFDNFMSRVHPEDVTYVKDVHEHAFANLNRLKYECRIITPQGDIRHIGAELVIRRDTDTNIMGLTGFIRIIADAPNKDRSTEATDNYRTLFDNLPQPTLIVAADTLQLLAVNNAAITMLGYPKSSFSEMRLPELWPDNMMQRIPAIHKWYEEPVSAGETWAMKRYDGTVSAMEVSSGISTWNNITAHIIQLTAATDSTGKVYEGQNESRNVS